MDKKKLLISGLTVAGFLAASALPHLGAVSFAGEKAKDDKKVEGKKGSCAGGSCGATKDKVKKEAETQPKEGSCSGKKDKGEKKDEKESGKKGSCTAMKE